MNAMDCDRILELLPGRLDGTLEEGQRREAESHLRDCPRCAAEEKALQETLALLRSLPAGKAPPELLEGVRSRIAEGRPRTAAGRGFLASSRIRIPLEAAAAVLLFLLVYGIQKQITVTDRPASPPARMETASPPEAPPEIKADAGLKKEAEPEVPPRTRPNPPPDARIPAGRTAPAERASLDEDRAEPSGERSFAPRATLPAVPATRVSTGAAPVAPRAREEERMEAPTPFRLFASRPSRPSRLLRPLPYGREVILEVAADRREGLEERIVRLVEEFGGSVLREWRFFGPPAGEEGGAPVTEGPMRIRLPADSAEPFLSELRKLGTIPPEGMPSLVDLPAGPAPEIVAYTVRIRVR